MKAFFTVFIAAVLLLSSCSDRPDCLTVSLEEAPLLEVLRVSFGTSDGTRFTDDSISQEELEEIRVTLKLTNVTKQEYLEHIESATGLSIEIVDETGVFRVTRKEE